MHAEHSASLTAEQVQDRLAELTAAAQREHLAVGHALSGALQHAMNAGDALLAMRELVSEGKWTAYLRDQTNISARSARVYIQVTKARAILERQSSAGLSIAAALEYLKDPAAKKSKSRPAAKSKPKSTTSFDALGWWMGATDEARRHLLDSVGLIEVLGAMPPGWRDQLEARVLNRQRARDGHPFSKGTAVFRKALSLAKTARTPGITDAVANSNRHEAVAALEQLNTLLAAAGADCNDIDLTFAKTATAKSRRCAA